MLDRNTIVEHTGGLRGVVLLPSIDQKQCLILWACLTIDDSACAHVNIDELKPVELPFVPFAKSLPPRNRRVMVRDKHGDHYPYGFMGNGDIALSAQYAGLVEWAEIY